MDKPCWEVGRAWSLRDPGAHAETIRYLDSNDPQTGFKPQRAIIILVFKGNSGGSEEGQGSGHMVPVSHLGDEVGTTALGSDGNVEDGSEVTCVKPEQSLVSSASSQRGKIDKLSPLPPETYICSHPL